MTSRNRLLCLGLIAPLLLTACPRDAEHEDPDTGFSIDVDDVELSDTDLPVSLALGSIAPQSGPLTGGTTVTLGGTGFAEGLQVFFGDQEAATVTRQGQLSAQATTPSAATAGAVDVTVVNPDGTEATLPNAFTYTDEVVDPGDPETVDYCQLQPQGTAADPLITDAGQVVNLRAFVYVEGVTDSAGQGADVQAELGYGADLADLSWGAMTYLGDLEGITPGELANDEYGRDVLFDEVGTFVYLARFRAADDDDWTLCGVDGPVDAPETGDAGAVLVEAPAVPSIGFCQTETTTLTAAPGEETAAITGVVYALGVTPGAGEGSGIDGRLVYGDAGDDPDDWTGTMDADYLEDADGLSPGDLSNDRYATTLTLTDEGTYGFRFEFRLDGGDWVSCDPTGTLTVEDPATVIPAPEGCGIQFPLIAEGLEDGQEVSLFGRVFEPGVTDQAELPTSLLAEALVGPAGANPVADAGAFTVLQGERNLAYVGDDFEEFEVTWTAEEGLHAYVFRFSLDDGDNWSYCGIDGLRAPDDVDPHRFGALATFDEAPELAGFCRTITTAATGPADGEGPNIEMEVYYAGITDVGGAPDGDALEVEVGFGPIGANPAFAYAFTPLSYDRLMVGNPSNYVYDGPAYASIDAPAAGSYYLVTRVRADGDEAWRYCNTSDSEANFFLPLTTSLTVE